MDTCLEPCVLREISKIAPVAEEKKVAVCERVTHVFMAVLKLKSDGVLKRRKHWEK